MIRILQGDVIDKLRELPDESIHCCVTSPPYWGLRDYSSCACSTKAVGSGLRTEEWDGFARGDATGSRAPDKRGKKEPDPNCPICKGTGVIPGVKEKQLGLENTSAEYVKHIVGVFREVWRVLRKDGTLWLNIGDSYSNTPVGRFNNYSTSPMFEGRDLTGIAEGSKIDKLRGSGLKPKDLCLIPARVAIALQDDGWYVRSDIIWAKRNCMPESTRDRPTKAHEYIFMLTKSQRYFWDREAVKEPMAPASAARGPVTFGSKKGRERTIREGDPSYRGGSEQWGRVIDCKESSANGRNIRTVWVMSAIPYAEAHFATFPPELPERCIKAGTSLKGCCPKCGAPWKRIAQRHGKMKVDSSEIDRFGTGEAGVHRKIGQKYQDWLDKNPMETVGWQPTCKCGLTETVPCTVLDPFAGSGTTGVVAKKLGRNAILIELVPPYIQLIRKRVGLGVEHGPLDELTDDEVPR